MSDTASLRDQQAEFTKNLLLEAARKVIIENEPEDFSMQKVAREAGVSHRTVYRYFPSRQALIDEFSEWLERRFENNMQEVSIGKIDEVAKFAFARFDRNAQFFEAAARLSMGGIRPSNQARRTEILRQEFDATFPDLDPAAADLSFAVLRHLIGLQSWFELRDRFALQDGESGEAVAWASRVLIAAINDGDVPAAVKANEDEYDP